jgi:hypothetical protein
MDLLQAIHTCLLVLAMLGRQEGTHRCLVQVDLRFNQFLPLLGCLQVTVHQAIRLHMVLLE